MRILRVQSEPIPGELPSPICTTPLILNLFETSFTIWRSKHTRPVLWMQMRVRSGIGQPPPPHTNFVPLLHSYDFHYRVFYNKIRKRSSCQLKAAAFSRLRREWRWVCGFAHPSGVVILQGSRRLRDFRPQVRPQQNWFTQRGDSGIQSVLETTYSAQRDWASTRDTLRTSGTQIFLCLSRFWMYINLCRGFFFAWVKRSEHIMDAYRSPCPCVFSIYLMMPAVNHSI
jgi:hypothetical protein